jgi:hypothetical protein
MATEFNAKPQRHQGAGNGGRLQRLAVGQDLCVSVPLRLGVIIGRAEINGSGGDAENGHRDGRTPRQSPNWWPCASTGQWQFGVDERRKKP